MSVALLHVSDIHFRTPADQVFRRADRIAHTLNGYPDCSTCIVVATGDIAFSGTQSQYDVAEQFFRSLLDTLRQQAPGRSVHFVAIPGNHDNDYERSTGVRETLLAQIRAEPNARHPDDVLSACSAVQLEYFSFLARMEPGVDTPDRLYYVRRFEVQGKSLAFHCYNTAWCARKQGAYGELVFPLHVLPSDRDYADVDIALFHHPLRWLSLDNQKRFQRQLESAADVVMTGHEHDPPRHVRVGLAESTLEHYEGGPLQPDALGASQFSIVFVDLEKSEHHHVVYEWNAGQYGRMRSSAPRPFGRNDHLRAGFRPSEQFETFLDESGRLFTHPDGGELDLADIYVPPQVNRVRAVPLPGRPPANIVPARALIDDLEKQRRALVYGLSWSGKTSLGKWACRQLLRARIVPLYVRGSDLVSEDRTQVPALLEKVFCDQYPPTLLESFRQLGPDRRALILDAFETCPLTKAARSGLLQTLESYFGRVVILADDDFRVDELAYGGTTKNPLLTYQHYDLLPFGHELRERLIKRWHDHSRGAVSDEEVDARIRHSAHVLRAVIGLGVPPYPFFLLAALQTEEAARKTQDAASGQAGSFGFIHEALVTRKLDVARRPVEIDTSYRYLAELAYAMFVKGRRTVTLEELATQHRDYESTYATDIDRGSLLQYLCQQSILKQEAGSISFRFPYLLPFFVAFALKDEPRFSEHVDALVDGLYKTENANITLFLAHFTRDERLVDKVMTKARSLYADTSPCNMEDSVRFLNGLNVEPIPLSLPDSSPDENRETLNMETDKRDASEGAPGASNDMNDVLRINMSLKTLGVLGQILKAFPGSTKAERKITIVRESFALGMRTLQMILGLMESNLEQLIDDLAGHISRRDSIDSGRAREKAAGGVFWLSQFLAFAMVWKTGDSVGLARLSRTYESVMSGDPPVSYELIDLAIRLDFFPSFPEAQILALREKLLDRNTLALRVLSLLVHRNLYLFQTNYRIRQRMSELFEFSKVKALPTFEGKRPG